MSDWKTELRKLRPKKEALEKVTITLPNHFIFKNHGVHDFEPIFSFFDWSIENKQVKIDFTKCVTANYQAMSLVVSYCWKLRNQGCRISFELSAEEHRGASEIWRRMGAMGLFQVSTDEKTNFRYFRYKPLVAIRNTFDLKKVISTAESYTEDFNVEYKNTLRHILSELVYNAQEHGVSHFRHRGMLKVVPSLAQFTWYKRHNEIHFIIVDTGIGIREHMSQTYAGLTSDCDAIKMAIKPQVSGTFGRTDPYESKNNAGVGLYISTSIVKRLKADMHIISGNGLLHISPRDVTTKELDSSWPGTIVLVAIKLDSGVDFAFHSMMQEFRNSAMKELSTTSAQEQDNKYYLSIDNYFGPYAEDKQAAIKLRDERLLPNIEEGKSVVVDFKHVESAPHSFLSALFATPVRRLGVSAYKRIKIVNSSPEIRETIDYIFDENTE